MNNLITSSHRILCGDFRKALYTVKEGTVDTIITDPPWEKRALSLYPDLVAHAYRILKPGGNLLIVTGGLQDWEIRQIVSPLLPHHHQFIFHLNNSRQYLTPKNLLADQRMVHWFRKPGSRPPFVSQTIFELEKPEKTFHFWGQPVKLFSSILKQISPAGSYVVDPFLGGGSSCIAALQNGCTFLGVDMDQEVCDVAQKRVKGVIKNETLCKV